MKKTYPIRTGQYWNLLRKFIADFGYPSYRQELVIYFDSPDHFKITLNRAGLRWSWADDSPRDEYIKTNHTVKTNLRDIKEKLLFFASRYGNKGHFSVAPVLTFYDKRTKIQVEMKSKSFIGEILCIITPDHFFKAENAGNKTWFDNFFKEEIEPLVDKDLLYRVDQIEKKNEEFIHFNISDSPILNTKIMDFCRENGIMSPFKKKISHRELLSSKSNNYSIYEELFFALTSVNLLTTDEHCTLPERPEKTVSIIIPCYNSDSTINKVLRSIRCQQIPKEYMNYIEVIIVDDGSNNEIDKVINKAEYPFHLEIIRLSNNHGVSHVRQLGVSHSSGDILIFIDADVILSSHYLADHIIRNTIIDNAVFVSFKENVSETDPRISAQTMALGIPLPKYSHDLRIHKRVGKNAIGSYEVREPREISILEETNFFKDFHGSRTFGVYDLSCMITGHNFSLKKELVLKSSPFSKIFKGWGMEDVYFGLKMISNGNYIIPVLSSGVFHIDHLPRSGSEERKTEEYAKNVAIINSVLDSMLD